MNLNITHFPKKIGYVLPLSIMFMLHGCTTDIVKPAPIEKIGGTSQQPNSPAPIPIPPQSQSYPLPPAPVLNESVSIEPIANSTQTVSITPNSPPNSLPNSQGQLVLAEVLGEGQSNTSTAPNAPALNPVTPIAGNSPVVISTQNQTINYSAPAGSPNWQAMAVKALDSLKASGQLNNLTGPIYINTVSNQTNATLPIFAIDQIILQNTFTQTNAPVVDNQSVVLAKQQLGIAPNDTLTSRKNAISIAKILNLNYLIYPSLAGDSTSPTLSMQLINAATSEILAEGQAAAAF